MIRFIVSLWLLQVVLFGANIVKPAARIEVKGIAKDMVLSGNHLIIGTSSGLLQVYDYKTKKFLKEVSIPTIKDFTGEIIPATVFSVDYIDGRYLLLSDSGTGGYSNLWIHENNQTKQLLSPKDQKPLIKARFVDKDHILLGYLSNEASLYDVKTGKELYRKQLTPSKFSDFALNDDHTKAAYGCESGAITVIRVKDGKVLKTLDSVNKDNVYKVDFKKDIVIAGGEDRKAAIYDLKTGKSDFIKGSFLIYAVALSPSTQRVAFALDEQNNISVYRRETKERIALLKGQKTTLNVIVFKDEKTLFSASDDNTVLMWKLNQ